MFRYIQNGYAVLNLINENNKIYNKIKDIQSGLTGTFFNKVYKTYVNH